MSKSNQQGPFVDPMPQVASVFSVFSPVCGKGEDVQCAGDGCYRTLTEPEKKVGLCTACQKKIKGFVPTIFMPTAIATFAPTSVTTFAPTSIMTFAPMAMAPKKCTVPGCKGHQIKDNSHKGWHCSRGSMCGR